MRHGIPTVYSVLRAAWSGLHFAMLAALFVAVAVWALHDGQGARLLTNWWQSSVGVRVAIATLLPFPWDT